MKSIPVHKLTNRASLGLEIHHTSEPWLRKEGKPIGVHRDDHYIFFMLEEGNASIMIDFNKVSLPAGSLFFILPGQVHHQMKSEGVTGWFIAVDAALINKDLRIIFEDRLLLQQPYCIDEERIRQCRSVLEVLNTHRKADNNSPLYLPVLNSLLNSFLGMVACGYFQPDHTPERSLRTVEIARQFKQLLTENMPVLKQPSAYAELMHISESYLNEVLKKITGFSVTYWITHEVMLEAKRLLCYTNLTVKEVAHQLGYGDHTYFSRLFKNANEITPLAFRNSYRK